MPHAWAAWLVTASLLYLGVGLVFTLVFVVWGAGALDASARGTSWSFRILLVPGSSLLWPWLLARWLSRRRSGAQDRGDVQP